MKTGGALTLLGDGELYVTQDLTVREKLTIAGAQQPKVSGTISENTAIYGIKPHLIVHIEAGDTRSLDELDDEWETVTVTGGGTFKVDSVAEKTKLVAVVLGKGSTLEVSGDVETAGDVTISGDGDFDITGKLTVKGDFFIDSADVKVDSLVMAEDKTLEIINKGSLTIRDEGITTNVSKVILSDDTTIKANGAFESGKISGTGSLEATSIDVETLDTIAGKELTLTGITVAVENVIGEGTVDVDGVLRNGSVSIATDATLQASGLADDVVAVEVSDDGTLVITGNVNLEEVDLKNQSSLYVRGVLTDVNESGIKLSGNGLLSAGTVEADKLTTVGDQTITAGSFDIRELAPENGKKLTLNRDGDGDGDVEIKKVSGTGSVNVNGILTAEELTIDSKATLEASNLAGKEGTATITGGGKLKVHNSTNVSGKMFLP